MNRYVSAGLLADANAGKRILVITDNQAAARHALAQAAIATNPDQISRVIRANGSEAIETKSGGSIRFTSKRGGGHRGLTVDICFVDTRLEPEQYDNIRPVVSATHGEMIRA